MVHILVDRYTDAALAGDRARAASLVGELLSTDLHVADVITGLLAASQVEVGQRWLDRCCSVGHEHSATFITESILSSVVVGLEPEESVGHLVMVCAEGEWHGLPARMASELLMLQGWHVTFLGPATPADHLRRYLADIDADAVGVSCTVAANLPGAARTVRVARRAGFDVVVGGGGFGTGRRAMRRARAIGADGFVAAVETLTDLDSVMWDRVPEPDVAGAWATIDRRHTEIVRVAMDWMVDDADNRAECSDSWLQAVIDDLDEIVRCAAAASLVDDPTVLVDHRRWLEQASAAAGDSLEVPDVAIGIAFEAVGAALERVAPGAAEIMVQASRIAASGSN